MRKYYVKKAKLFRYAPKWPLLVFIWVLYALFHYHLGLISDFSSFIVFLTAYGVGNYLRINFNERYLIFGENSLIYGTKFLTLWHIPLNKICRIEKEAVKGQFHSFNVCTEKVVIYTSDNDSFELYNIFQESEFIEIESQLKKIVATTNEATASSSECIVVV